MKNFLVFLIENGYLPVGTKEDYLTALGIFVLLLAVFLVVRKIFLVAARRTSNRFDDALVTVIESIKRPAYVTVALVTALQSLQLPHWLDRASIVWLLLVGIFYAVRALTTLIDHIVERTVVRYGDKDGHAAAAATLLGSVARVVVWTAGILLVAANMGVNITSLIAGLGIGGIAVALALQGILKDLFASFSLFFDKPFTIGDFIDADGNKGTVQKIGIKTTRLKSLSGEEIIIPNQDLTSTKVHNYRRMSQRRVSFNIGVVYETSTEDLRRLPQIIREIIERTEHVDFSRAHFKEFADWALVFEIVYFVRNRDYEQYLDAQQQINLRLKERLEKEGIQMAYPTQVVYHRELVDSSQN